MGIKHDKKPRDVYVEIRKRAPKIIIYNKEYDQQTIYENDELKRQLVKENPRLAEQLYYQWRETGEIKIGIFFAERYNGDKEHGASAYHIGIELGVPNMRKPNNTSLKDIERLEDGFFM